MSLLLQNANLSFLHPNNPRCYLHFPSEWPREEIDLMRKDEAKANMPSLCVSSVIIDRAFCSCRIVQNIQRQIFIKLKGKMNTFQEPSSFVTKKIKSNILYKYISILSNVFIMNLDQISQFESQTLSLSFLVSPIKIKI